MNINLKLKSTRVGNAEVQADVAKILGISEQSYNRKELGQRDFRLSECIKLAEHYGKSLDELFNNKINIKKTK